MLLYFLLIITILYLLLSFDHRSSSTIAPLQSLKLCLVVALFCDHYSSLISTEFPAPLVTALSFPNNPLVQWKEKVSEVLTFIHALRLPQRNILWLSCELIEKSESLLDASLVLGVGSRPH